MDNFKLMGYVEKCIQQLSVEIGARPAGTPENQAAADFIAQEFKRAGYEVFRQEYPCPDWQSLSCELSMAGEKVPATVNTHSPSCDWEAEMVPVSSIEELARLNIRKKIAVLYGDITSSSILPTNFDRRYHQVEIQDRFMELLIKKRPAAIITVSHYDGLYPVVMEDSELNIPSVTVTRQDGLRILQNNSATARLKIISTCQKSSGANIIGCRRGSSEKKIVVCAHYDTKPGTPGAVDNGSGVSSLLLLAWYLQNVQTELSIELVAFGGEDSWFPGDAKYLEEYPPDNVIANINIDGIGVKEIPDAIAFFACPGWLQDRVMELAGNCGEYIRQAFYAGDHCFFWTRGILTLALTSGGMELLGTIVHTPNDTPEFVVYDKIEQASGLLRDTILILDQQARHLAG